MECVYEETLDPSYVIELTGLESVGRENGASVMKDLRKDLRRAEKEDVHVAEMNLEEWPEEDKRAIEQGIADWKSTRTSVQIAAT